MPVVLVRHRELEAAEAAEAIEHPFVLELHFVAVDGRHRDGGFGGVAVVVLQCGGGNGGRRGGRGNGGRRWRRVGAREDEQHHHHYGKRSGHRFSWLPRSS